MFNFSRETNVAFLREAGQLMQEKIFRLELRLAEAEQLALAVEVISNALAEELSVLKEKFFASGRERFKNDKQPKKRKRKNLLHDRPPVEVDALGSVELDCEEEIFSIPETELACSGTCGCNMQPMEGGFEEAVEVSVIERKFILRRLKRQKYICRTCATFKTAPAPEKLIKSGEFSVQMAVEVADDKFNRHLPLERQVTEMAESGLKVSSKTLYSLTEHLHNRLSPITNKIREEILSQPTVCIDETPMKLLGNDSNGYVWGICNSYGTYYQYETTRSGAVAREMLKGYSGNVMSDGYSGYNWVDKVDNLNLTACWSHARRKFFDARNSHPGAKQILSLIDKLFALEHEAESNEDLQGIRSSKSRSLINQIHEAIEKYRLKALPTSLLGKAISYTNSQWPYLVKFIVDSTIPLSNNAAERALRSPVLGRKNFLGFRSINGADVGMTFYTIINTCKLLGLSPKAYLLESALRSCRNEELQTPYQYAKKLEAIATSRLEETMLQFQR